MSVKLKNLIISIIPVLVTGAICSYFSRTGVKEWFGALTQNMFMPPNYVFSIAWSIIYILLTVSFYRILKSPAQNKTYAIRIYWQQLILQILWCGLFFGAQMPLIGGLIILWLDMTVLRMICAFFKIDKTAAFLNIFYLCYICFATFLNWSFLYHLDLIKTF